MNQPYLPIFPSPSCFAVAPRRQDAVVAFAAKLPMRDSAAKLVDAVNKLTEAPETEGSAMKMRWKHSMLAANAA